MPNQKWSYRKSRLHKEIDTYTYLVFDARPDEYWRFATYNELYNTVDNGGLFPWDDNLPRNSFLGMKAAYRTTLSFIALSTAAFLYI